METLFRAPAKLPRKGYADLFAEAVYSSVKTIEISSSFGVSMMTALYSISQVFDISLELHVSSILERRSHFIDNSTLFTRNMQANWELKSKCL